jgi:hypothetical protein
MGCPRVPLDRAAVDEAGSIVILVLSTGSAQQGEPAPVLLMAFNRPERFAQLLQQVAAQGSARRVYIAVDGPRRGHPTDEARTAEVRALADGADRLLDAPVRTLFQSENLGCRHGVNAALDWFFEQEECGTVLEDDCHPAPGLLAFTDWGLARYAHEPSVWMVSGYNHLGCFPADADVLFSDGGAWGWATWSDRWRSHREVAPSSFSAEELQRVAALTTRGWARLISRGLDLGLHGDLDTWDYDWAASRLRHGGLTAISARNGITNVGAGSDATHGARESDTFMGMAAYPLPAEPRVPAGAPAMSRSYLRRTLLKHRLNLVQQRLRGAAARVHRIAPGGGR